jgi:hypothetical protein
MKIQAQANELLSLSRLVSESYRFAWVLADGLIGLRAVNTTSLGGRRGIAFCHTISALMQCNGRAEVGHSHLFQHITQDSAPEKWYHNRALMINWLSLQPPTDICAL